MSKPKKRKPRRPFADATSRKMEDVLHNLSDATILVEVATRSLIAQENGMESSVLEIAIKNFYEVHDDMERLCPTAQPDKP